MSKKHDIWFDLITHNHIHQKVIESFSWLIKEGGRRYDTKELKRKASRLLQHHIKFITVNGYQVEIGKLTLLSPESPPKKCKTISFSYNCFGENPQCILQYHSPHGKAIDNSPWHDKYHRHELRDDNRAIRIYDTDTRTDGKKNKNYSWLGKPTKVTFVEEQSWPHVSEFLQEVASLANQDGQLTSTR